MTLSSPSTTKNHQLCTTGDGLDSAGLQNEKSRTDDEFFFKALIFLRLEYHFALTSSSPPGETTR